MKTDELVFGFADNHPAAFAVCAVAALAAGLIFIWMLFRDWDK